MALPSDYISGTITLEAGEVSFSGTGTGWLAADFREGDIILDIAGGGGRTAVIAAISGNGAGTLSKPWEGPDLTAVAYRIRYQWDSSRVSAQTRTMIEKLGNGNLESLSGVTGPGVLVMDGPHSVTVRPETDFINGVAYDVQVDDLAGRAAYDGQTEGFAVLVSDIGDGRSAIYSKASNTSGDWTAPAYVTGPVGPAPDFSAGTTTTVPPGTPADVDLVPDGSGGYVFYFDIPQGRGAVYAGAYNPATAYGIDDAVLDNGSTWIATAATTGNAPPTLPTTSNAYWSLLARAGTDGAGTGDVVGPAGGTVDNGFVLFASTTGKLIKTATAAAYTALLDAFTTTTKGLVPAPVTSSGRFLRDDATWVSIPPPDMLAVSIIALQVADNTNLPISGPSWLADSFESLSMVDVAGATNLDVSAAGILRPSTTLPSTAYTNTGGEGNRVGTITVTTSFGTVSGTSANLIDGSETPGATNSVDYSASLGDGEYIRFDFGTNKYIDEVNWRAGSSPGAGSFKVRGSNDASVWTDLASFAMDNANKVIPLSGVPGSGFRYYELTKVSTQTQSRPWYTEVRFKIATSLGGVANMSVRSAVMTAASAPSSVEAIIQLKEIVAATPVTDYTVEFSRDNGATWTAATLTELFTSQHPAADIIFVRAAATVSAQPSGTSVRWRIATITGKMIEFHGIKTEWI